MIPDPVHFRMLFQCGESQFQFLLQQDVDVQGSTVVAGVGTKDIILPIVLFHDTSWEKLHLRVYLADSSRSCRIRGSRI